MQQSQPNVPNVQHDCLGADTDEQVLQPSIERQAIRRARLRDSDIATVVYNERPSRSPLEVPEEIFSTKGDENSQ